MSQAERANEAEGATGPADGTGPARSEDAGTPMPAERLLDVSPLALRMSSPFNAGYWLSAA